MARNLTPPEPGADLVDWGCTFFLHEKNLKKQLFVRLFRCSQRDVQKITFLEILKTMSKKGTPKASLGDGAKRNEIQKSVKKQKFTFFSFFS